MHKGIRLALKLWVEGEDEPAHDFFAYTKQAIQEILVAGRTLYPGLKVDLKMIEEDTSWVDEDDQRDV